MKKKKLRVVPPEATTTPVAFLDGQKGYAQQIRRCEEYGVTVTATRETRDHPFVIVFTVDGLEGEFESFDAMNEAIKKALKG